MTTTIGNGRLCNQIIRNLAVNIIALKHNLFVKYSSQEEIEKLGIPLFCGEKNYPHTVKLTDDNYFYILNQPEIYCNLDANGNFFQTKTISNLLYIYLREAIVKNKIIEKNRFCDRYNKNNDVCVHLRLTDTAQWNPGLHYYLNTLSKLQFDTLYLTSDDRDHQFLKDIQEKYKSAVILDYNPVETIQFASTCKHIILSHGSFSAVIGYLAYYSDIYYPEYEPGKIWFGDIFSIDGWNKMTVKPNM